MEDSTGRTGWGPAALIQDVPDKESIGIASQELPFPFLKVWSVLRHQHLRRVHPEVVHAMHRQGYIVTDFYPAAWLLSVAARDRLFIKLVPTAYGTTVVHYGVLRRIEHEEIRDQATVRRLLAALHRTAADGRPLTSRGLFALMDLPSPLDPEPRAGELGDHEPGGEFLFVPRGR